MEVGYIDVNLTKGTLKYLLENQEVTTLTLPCSTFYDLAKVDMAFIRIHIASDESNSLKNSMVIDATKS